MSTDAQEPTMDDILASIRRIIAEDNEKEAPPTTQETAAQESPAQEAAPQAAVADKPAEVAASKPAPQAAPVQAAAPRAAQPAPSAAQPTGGGQAFVMERQAEEDEDGEVLVLNNLLENAKAAAKPLPNRPNSAKPGGRQGGGRQALPAAPNGKLSRQEEERLLSATTESLGTAAFATLERAVRMGRAGETLEDVVRNLLRPMLRGWIDQNLPGLVERMVQSEIQKIVSGARRSWEDEDPDQ